MISEFRSHLFYIIKDHICKMITTNFGFYRESAVSNY